MTIKEAIDTIKDLKPSQFSDATLVGWLSDIDGQIWQEVISWHNDTNIEKPSRYSATDDLNKELIVVSPYTDVYIKGLSAQIDFWNNDLSRYNNSMIMFNTALSAYSDWFNRTYMPKQNNYVEV